MKALIISSGEPKRLDGIKKEISLLNYRISIKIKEFNACSNANRSERAAEVILEILNE